MRDREICIMDLVVGILLGWRVILILMLIGGILMGGLSYVQSYQAQEAQIAEQLTEQAQLQQGEETYFLEQLTDVQYYNVRTVLENERYADGQELYLQESVKMQLDAFNLPRVELIYWVSADDLKTAHQIKQIYEDTISSGLGKWLAEGEEEISAAAMNELVELRSDDDVAFCIYIYHMSEEQCLYLAEKAEEYVQDQNARLRRELGSHEISLVSQNFSVIMDMSLWDRQQSIRNNILSLRSGCAKTKASFLEEEWLYYNCITGDNTVEDSDGQQAEADDVMVIQPSISPVLILAGMFVFAFLYVIYVLLKYAMNKKLQITDDVNALYGVHELGVIPAASKKKKILALVDDWILKFYNRNKRQFSFEKAIGLAAAAVNIAAQKEGLQEVCCVGCDLQKDALVIADIVENTLNKENITMKVISDVLYNQESMERILSAKGAFLLEKAGETLYDEIDKELKLLYRQEIKVLGVIVME